ncbi:phage integrase family protein [Pseudobutyrivibrio xylanivorans]|nr:phage integrase family protein [Pseudobutyrivibrio xylanivorans]
MIQRGRLDYFVILTLYDYSYAELNTILDIKLKDIEVTSGKRVYFTPETIIFIPEYEFRLPEEHHKLVVRCLTKLAEGKKDDDYIFLNNNGKRVSQKNFSLFISRAKKELNIDDFSLRKYRNICRSEDIVNVNVNNDFNDAINEIIMLNDSINKIVNENESIFENDDLKILKDACNIIKETGERYKK